MCGGAPQREKFVLIVDPLWLDDPIVRHVVEHRIDALRIDPLPPRKREAIQGALQLPLRSNLLSVTSAVKFATESRGRPVAVEGKNTLRGIVAKAVFEVITATNTVDNRLSL